jgi:hypothetical protein
MSLQLYDCLHLRQHRLEVVTGDAGAIVVLSATLDSKDWVFFVGAKCRGRPLGPFACRFLTVIQQKDMEPTQRARLVVWRLHVPVPWRAHVCCTPALMDVLHCAVSPDAGLVAPDVISTVLLTLVLHHVADGSAHEIVRRTLDRLSCDGDALKDLPSLLWLCLATAILPPSCVSSLVVVTAKRMLMSATERVQDPISVLLLAWVAQLTTTQASPIMDKSTAHRARQAAVALQAPDGGFGQLLQPWQCWPKCVRMSQPHCMRYPHLVGTSVTHKSPGAWS